MTPFQKTRPIEALNDLIFDMKGGHEELVIIRRLMLRATGLLPLASSIHSEVEAFLHEAALLSLELELSNGVDISGGRERLGRLLLPIRQAVGKRAMN